MSKVPVSICIIAKNEEKYIEECLKRIVKYGCEIVLADTGSIDRTKDIASKYADKIVDFSWVNDFSIARNYVASVASNQIIMALDCDEYVEQFDVARTMQYLKKTDYEPGIFRIKHLFRTEDGISYETGDAVRIYDRERYEFSGAVHEQIVRKIKEKDEKGKEKLIESFFVPIEVIHHGYDIDEQQLKQKQYRNIDIMKKALEMDPLNSYLWFQMGQSYFILEDYEHAVLCYEKVLQMDISYDEEYVQTTLRSLAKAYLNQNRQIDAITILKKYEIQCDDAHYAYTQGYIASETHRYIDALRYFEKCVSYKDSEKLGSTLLNAYQMIVNICMSLNDVATAQKYLRKYEDVKKNYDRQMKYIQ